MAWKSNKVCALLAYLAVEHDRPHTREALAGLLWPDLAESAALANLRDALSNLRRLLQDRTTFPPLLLVTGGSLQFNAQADAWVDALAFARVVAGTSGPEALEQALALVKGDFLDGFFVRDSAPMEEWQLLKREQVQRQVAVALYRLAAHESGRGAYAQAALYLRRLLPLAPYDEEACRRLMWVLALDGKRGEALALYQACRDLLHRDLGIAPAAETTALYRRIRDKEVGDWAAGRVGWNGSKGPGGGVGQSAAVEADAGPGRFVGRESEVARLEGWLESALSGQGRVVLVSGEAGSGKTALLDAFAARAVSAHGALVVARGRCNAHAGAGDPYLPFREILQALAGDVEGQRAAGPLPAEQARRLWALLPTAARVLADHGPDLVDTFVPGAALLRRVDAFAPSWRARLEALAARPRPAEAQSPPRQTALFAQVTAVLSALARHAPLLLIVDDLHWADGGTAALLFHLSRRLAGSPILLACAYRPLALGPADDGPVQHPFTPLIHEFGRAWGDTAVDLEHADGRRFVDALLDAEPNHLEAPFRERFYRHTGGNALFAVELLRALRGRGDLLRDEAGAWIEAPGLDWSHSPARVEAVLAGQLINLPAGDRALLETASVQGETFIAEVVARALDTDAAEVVRRLSGPLARLYRLVSAANLEWVPAEAPSRSEEGAVGGPPSAPRSLSHYRFRHILVQDYLYRQLDEVTRARLHEATGRAIETLLAPDPSSLALHAGRLARHFAAAGRPLSAAKYQLRAAEQAMRLSAPEEAIAHLRHGLALLSDLPDSAESAQLRLELYLALNTPIVFARGFASAEQAELHEHIYALCRHPALADSPGRVTALALVAYSAAWLANTGLAITVGRQLLDLAQARGDPRQVVVACWVLGTAYLYANEIEPAREYLDRAMSGPIAVQHGLPGRQYQVDPGVYSAVLRAALLWLQGYPDQARRDLEAARQSAKRVAHPPSRALAHLQAAAVRCLFGRDSEPIAQIVRSPRGPGETTTLLEGLRDLLSARQQAETAVAEGLAADREGQMQDVLLQARAGLEAVYAAGPPVGRVLFLLLLADGYVTAGRYEPAADAVEQALRLIERTGVRFCEPEAHRLRGELFLARGDRAAAGECFVRAIDVARALGLRWWELRATASLARLWRQEGHREQAGRALAGICGRFEEGADLPDLAEARTLLRELVG